MYFLFVLFTGEFIYLIINLNSLLSEWHQYENPEVSNEENNLHYDVIFIKSIIEYDERSTFQRTSSILRGYFNVVKFNPNDIEKLLGISYSISLFIKILISLIASSFSPAYFSKTRDAFQISIKKKKKGNTGKKLLFER